MTIKWAHFPITIGILCFVIPTWADTIKDSMLTSLFKQYYTAIHAGKETQARLLLHQILDRDPHNVRAWRALGYSYSSSGEYAKAAKAFTRGLKTGGNDPLLALQTGYAYNAAGNASKAEDLFESALNTKNSHIYGKACSATINDAPLYQKHLPGLWYLTFYNDDFYESRINDAIFPVKIRLGRYIDKKHRVSVYTYFHFNDDTRSHGGILPEIYNDNYAGLGLGIDWSPLSNRSLRLFAETGAAYSLSNTNHPAWRNDTTVGAEFYKAWGYGDGCGLHATWPLRPFGDVYASVAYYTRYSDAIGQVLVRQGVRLFNYRLSSLSAYLKINIVGDSDNIYYNNIIEFGPGLSWRPDQKWPIDLRAEYLFGKYYRGIGQSTDGGSYTTWLLQAIVYFEQ